MALVILGAVIAVMGVFILWAATFGRDWNSTHNRLSRETPRVSAGQQRYNTVAGVVCGTLAVAAGVACIVIR